MDFDLPPDDDPRRVAVREWLDAHPRPTGRQLAAAGYVVPQWPQPWGLGADPIHQLIIDDELDRAGVVRPGGIGIGWAAPTLLAAGTPEQHQRFLPGILSGEDQWCQLFSEPDAGSDLASVSTRAERDGDEYVVKGSKIWTSGAHHSRYGILIARTNPDVPKHEALSYFVCPMDLPGITLWPIVDMTTAHSFNQVFLDGVRIPASLRVGDEGAGWRLAKVTLSNERVMLSSAGSLWGSVLGLPRDPRPA
jgi:3-oxochol-4-en-24-oyl-CoA dehydrogenase